MRILPLGGLGEVGMNCMALEENGDVVVIDCGVSFDSRGLGVDVVYPDVRALSEYNVRGVLLTHGHEDHIGAVHHLLAKFDAPVYATRYTAALLDRKADEHEILQHARIETMAVREPFTLGPFQVEALRVTHSTIDAVGLAIRMREGTVIHTGDYKIDPTPPDGMLFDEERFAAYGREGVALLLADSTNSEVPGTSGSEASVRAALEDAVRSAPARVVCGLFASNVHRMKVMLDVAAATGRVVAFAGRSLATHSALASQMGWLSWPAGLIVPVERASEVPREKLMVLATGTQGEAYAALAMLARAEHPFVTLDEGDRVVFSSRVIPGNELEVQAIITQFLRRGIDVETPRTRPGLHVSGHANREEQKRMFELTQPRTFVPVHGATSHLYAQAKLARELGVAQVVVVENGEAVKLEAGTLARDGTCLFGTVLSMNKVHVPHGVVGERRALASNGFANVIVRVDAHDEIVHIELVDRGVTTSTNRADALRDLVDKVHAAWREAPHPQTLESRCEAARTAARRTLGTLSGMRPITVVTPIRG